MFTMSQFVRNILGRRSVLSNLGAKDQQFRLFRTSFCALQESVSSLPPTSEGFLRESYLCNEAWNKRLETPLIKKINLDDFFYDIDKRYQVDKVISAIDVDLFVNRVTDEEHLDELEELIHRLRRSPATVDSLPSSSHAVIRALLNAGKTEDLMRILDDRWNYGVFVDCHMANILMDEFLKQGKTRDAAKVASLLMLEEDFGSPTSQYFAILSCLKYLLSSTPEAWDITPKQESDEEIKVRLYYVRNPYFDDHFDLTDPNHLIGKTLAMLAGGINDKTLSNSLQLLGYGLYGKWDRVLGLLKDNKIPVAEYVINKLTELCEKAAADIEASPNKTLPKPKVHQHPGVNLDDKGVNKMWELLEYPEFEKVIPEIKSLLTSTKTSKDLDLIQKTQELLSAALNDCEDKEIQEHLKLFEDFNQRRIVELENQVKRFKTFEVVESVKSRKKELKEKEEVIFFFDNEEEWMMRLPPDEQKGYKLSTEYIPTNYTRFVKTVPPKKIKKKTKKV